MDYEKKYKEALERMKGYVKDEYGCTRLRPEAIFPELKESEDERIRKAIKYGLDYVFTNNTTVYETTKERCLAWLEKQGEQKPILDVPFGAKDSELEEVSYSIPNGYHAEIEDNKVVIKKGEPKPAWSEEDEEIHRKCICAMRTSACSFPEEEKFVEQVDNWLKSLKDRYSWKPSEQQLKTLQVAIDIIGEETLTGTDLKELLEQFEKLKG